MKRPLKRSMSGEEMEFFILHPDGYMADDSAPLQRIAKRRFPQLNILPEAGKSMVEISSFPSVDVMDTFLDMIEKTKLLVEVADENGYLAFPGATYPGEAKTQVTPKKRYLEQEVLFGREKALQATRAAGFHFHYTLPRGVFDNRSKFLKTSVKSKLAQSMMDSYNLAISLDPALTTLMQSSPYVQGDQLAKDSRMLIYRGGKKLGYDKGKYSHHQALGGLPPYKQTLSDLVFSLRKRQQIWKDMMLSHNLNPARSIRNDNILEFTWNPVRISRHGTLELRGMDMNHPHRSMGIASMLKFVFRAIYRDYYHVLPSEIGLKEPFKVEGKTIFIPPHSYVRNLLQKESAYLGFDSRNVCMYTARFFRFAKQFTEREYAPLIRPIQSMIEEKVTSSDNLLKRARKFGFKRHEKIPKDVGAELALKSCERLFDEVTRTEENLHNALNIEPKKA